MIVGITGAFGCGKSTLLAIFAEAGFRVRSADAVCHEIYRENDSEPVAALIRRWGAAILDGDGGINRRALAEIVFADDDGLDFLNRTMHPEIRRRLLAEIAAARSEGGKLAVEVPLLFEGNWQTEFDCTVALWVDPAIRIARLAGRGFSPEEVARRDGRQLPPERKIELADRVLVNNGTPEELAGQCRRLIGSWNGQ